MRVFHRLETVWRGAVQGWRRANADRRQRAVSYHPGPLCYEFDVLWAMATRGGMVADQLLETGYTWAWRYHKSRLFPDWEARMSAGEPFGETFDERPLTALAEANKEAFMSDLQLSAAATEQSSLPRTVMEVFGFRDVSPSDVNSQLVQRSLRLLNQGTPGPLVIAIVEGREYNDQNLCLAQPIAPPIADLLSKWGTGPLQTPEGHVKVRGGPRPSDI